MGSDPSKVFLYEAFLKQLQKFASYAAFVGPMLLAMLFAETLPDMDAIAESDNIVENDDEFMPRVSEHDKKAYNERIVAIFDHMARFGYI